MTLQLSVVMPYYENQRTLRACLDGFVNQRQAAQTYEIVVVDDGSAHPATAVGAWTQEHPRVILLKTDHAGQSAATNAGIRAARGDVVLLTCADIIPCANLLAQHLRSHQEAKDEIAVLGHIPYPDAILTTPFMRYLALPGAQFAFELIQDHEHVPPVFCYAPNFSARRATLEKVGLFDERFIYGYQDTDLGVRLALAGVRTVYRPTAIGYHDHPNSLRNFVRRQRLVGQALLHMLHKYPRGHDVACMRQNVAACLPHLPNLEKILVQAEAIEARASQKPALASALQPQLNGMYHQVLAMALVDGLMTHGNAALRALGLPIA